MTEWIWYPGEFEIKTVNDVNMRRTKRNRPTMLIWKAEPIYPHVRFTKTVKLDSEEQFTVRADGKVLVETNGRGRYVPYSDGVYRLPAGEHKLSVYVYAEGGKIACAYIDGKSVRSDASWQCTLQDGVFLPVECDGFTDAHRSPNEYRLPTERREYVSKQKVNGYTLYDFGRETFGYVCFSNTNNKGKICIYFGESREEALDADYCEQFEIIDTEGGQTQTAETKAFRYVAVKAENGAEFGGVFMLYEYNPQPRRAMGKFSDVQLQKIWDVSMHTLELCTREFFLDGIKRDRWVWSGDATQAYLMNWYSFFDETTANRTQTALAGKGEITQHINTIVDYTMYWIISFYDNYLYTGNRQFIARRYSRMRRLAEYVLSCADRSYRIKKRPQDWVFIDWGKGIHTDVDSFSFLQVLLFKSMQAASAAAKLCGETDDSNRYADIAEQVLSDLRQNYWSESAGGYVFGIKDGKQDGLILRQPNIMASLYGAATEEQKQSIVKNVLKNKSVPMLETPYMRFYELSVLCEAELHEEVMQEIKSYWGGMISLDATSFWEVYRPEETGTQHYAMYNTRYGRSLCHAWGASPVWLLGRYFAGLSPLDPGYGRYLIEPSLGALEDAEFIFPIQGGEVRIEKRSGTLTIFCAQKEGVLRLCGEQTVIPAGQEFKVRL